MEKEEKTEEEILITPMELVRRVLEWEAQQKRKEAKMLGEE